MSDPLSVDIIEHVVALPRTGCLLEASGVCARTPHVRQGPERRHRAEQRPTLRSG